MLGQIFGKFKPREFVTRGEASDYPSTLKVYEMSVRRAPRHVREFGSDIRDADWVPT